MRHIDRRVTLALLLGLAPACAAPPADDAADEATPIETIETIDTIDQRSYDLGVIAAFAEVVQLGVKRLALSAAVDPPAMARLLPEARRIAERHDVLLFHETDFLVTDLFPEPLTDGKEVLLIYRDPVKDEYDAIRADRDALVAEGRYEGEPRAEIARRLGRLLSYSADEIERLLSP